MATGGYSHYDGATQQPAMGYGEAQQPGYGGAQQSGYGGAQQSGYGGAQQPAYGGAQPAYAAAQQPAMGYGDGGGYSTTGYRNYNDHYSGAAASPSGASNLKQKRSYDLKRFLYIPSTKWTWAFFLTILLQLIICLALESTIFAMFQQDLLAEAANPAAANKGQIARTIPTYLSLLIFAFVYELVLTYDALLSQNTIQVIGLVIMNTGIIIYTGIQKDQIHTAYNTLVQSHFIANDYWQRANPYLTALPCLVALFTVIMGGLTYALFMEFGWKIYKQIGADRKMKNRYLIYQIYIALLKFDFYLFIGFAIQFLVIVQGTSDSERDITYAFLPIFVILLLLAAWSARHENVPATVVSMFFYIASFAYFLFKLVRMYNAPPDRLEQYAPARKTLVTFAVITLVLLVITIVIAAICWANYNKGLMVHILKRDRSGSVGTNGASIDGKESQYPLDPYRAPGSGESGQYAGRLPGGRMEID